MIELCLYLLASFPRLFCSAFSANFLPFFVTKPFVELQNGIHYYYEIARILPRNLLHFSVVISKIAVNNKHNPRSIPSFNILICFPLDMKAFHSFMRPNTLVPTEFIKSHLLQNIDCYYERTTWSSD